MRGFKISFRLPIIANDLLERKSIWKIVSVSPESINLISLYNYQGFPSEICNAVSYLLEETSISEIKNAIAKK